MVNSRHLDSSLCRLRRPHSVRSVSPSNSSRLACLARKQELVLNHSSRHHRSLAARSQLAQDCSGSQPQECKAKQLEAFSARLLNSLPNKSAAVDYSEAQSLPEPDFLAVQRLLRLNPQAVSSEPSQHRRSQALHHYSEVEHNRNLKAPVVCSLRSKEVHSSSQHQHSAQRLLQLQVDCLEDKQNQQLADSSDSQLSLLEDYSANQPNRKLSRDSSVVHSLRNPTSSEHQQHNLHLVVSSVLNPLSLP